MFLERLDFQGREEKMAGRAKMVLRGLKGQWDLED